ITVRVEVVGLEPDPAAALARLVDGRIALVLALDRQEYDVVDRAFACVRVRIGATAHSVERGEPGGQQHALQVGSAEPATAALAAHPHPTRAACSPPPRIRGPGGTRDAPSSRLPRANRPARAMPMRAGRSPSRARPRAWRRP